MSHAGVRRDQKVQLGDQRRRLAQAADDLTVQSGDRQVLVRPIPLARAAFALRGYAALGDPTDSVTALARRVDQLVDASIEPNRVVSPAELIRKDLRIYAHSPLLYWWPVWFAGFLAAAWTWLHASSLTGCGSPWVNLS